MSTARFVIMVPTEVEADVIGNDDMMTEWGRQIAESYPKVHSLHPRQPEGFTAFLVESVRVDESDEPARILDELVSPSFAA
jgi:hypothetical protein